MTRKTLAAWAEDQNLSPAIRTVFGLVADCGVEIVAALRKAAVTGQTGATDTVNVQGEVQKQLDVVSNEIFLRRGAQSGVLAAMVSEELDDISLVEDAGPEAHYALVFDPLDGSSNLDVNGAVGSIFSLLDLGKSSGITQDDVLQAGDRQIAAGYVLYGPATVMAVTAGRGTALFSLDEAAGEFVLSNPRMDIPAETSEFAINASRRDKWYKGTRDYIEGCLAGKNGPFGKSYNMRWCAAMVADVHRVLTRGGVFLYPEDEETKARGGRLRLLYEANPMGLLIEQAGGAASTGTKRILEVQPTALHQRIGVIVGSRTEVARIVGLY